MRVTRAAIAVVAVCAALRLSSPAGTMEVAVGAGLALGVLDGIHHAITGRRTKTDHAVRWLGALLGIELMRAHRRHSDRQ